VDPGLQIITSDGKFIGRVGPRSLWEHSHLDEPTYHSLCLDRAVLAPAPTAISGGQASGKLAMKPEASA
jgi:hypothetical protein